MSKFNTNMMLGAAVGMIAMFITLTIVMNSGRADSLPPEVAALPECDPAAMADTDPPCRLEEDGETFIYWDGTKSRPGPAPTPEPIPYATQSVHPDILATAEAQGVTLSLDDYEEVYPGVVHNHFPIECDGNDATPIIGACGESWLHRFDKLGFPEKFNDWPALQKHGINYVKVDSVYYMDDLSQLAEPTSVPPSPTSAGG